MMKFKEVWNLCCLRFSKESQFYSEHLPKTHYFRRGPRGAIIGDTIVSGTEVPIKMGNALPLSAHLPKTHYFRRGPRGAIIGDTIVSGTEVPIKMGNALPLSAGLTHRF
ncbi:hypothetical protein YC2023_068759 [Brassica napus]